MQHTAKQAADQMRAGDDEAERFVRKLAGESRYSGMFCGGFDCRRRDCVVVAFPIYNEALRPERQHPGSETPANFKIGDLSCTSVAG